MDDSQSKDLDRISRGWDLATEYSRQRLRRVHSLGEEQMDRAVREGLLVLETVCLFVHACIKCGQFKMPSEFWRLLHAEYGIVVYPSALTEPIDMHAVGTEVTFTEAYCGHIVMLGPCTRGHVPPCPMEMLREAPPEYREEEPARTSVHQEACR